MADIVPFPIEYGRHYTVLVVDDEPAIRAVLCEFLKECGLGSVSAGSAGEALALMESRGDIDLVFSDVRMPGGMDGCALAHWILENKPELPVILATGDARTVHAAGLSQIETFGKPYDFEAAVRKIRDTIIHHRVKNCGSADPCVSLAGEIEAVAAEAGVSHYPSR